MMTESETILSVLAGQSDDVRTVVALRNHASGTAVELRQESFSPAVGWFMQSRIELSAEQVAGLRQTLGLVPGRALRAERPSGAADQHQAILSFSRHPRAATA